MAGKSDSLIVPIQISKNSRNSSKPPSSDDKDKIKKNQSLRKKTSRKPGGQTGRKGKTLKRVPLADETIEHVPKGRCQCGMNLKDLELSKHSSRQVFEIEFKKRVTEHEAYQGTCSCGEKHIGDYPKDVKANVQYGASVRGFVNYLSQYQLLPQGRLEELMQDLFDIPLSQGSINNFSEYALSGLEEFKSEVFEHVEDIKVAHVDETGTRVNGSRGFLHVFSTDYLSFLYYASSRGMKGVDSCGLLNKFKGTLIHDCFQMYFNYGKEHGICNAHLLRELTFIEEKYEYEWASRTKIFLLDLNELIKLDKEDFFLRKVDKTSLYYDFKRILLEGREEVSDLIDEASKRNRGKMRGRQHVALNLLNRLLKLRKDILRFMFDYDIAFTNNLAERDLRMTKVHLKISGGFRSERGAENYSLFRSYISTVKKHGLNILEALENLHKMNENPTLKAIFKGRKPIST